MYVVTNLLCLISIVIPTQNNFSQYVSTTIVLKLLQYLSFSVQSHFSVKYGPYLKVRVFLLQILTRTYKPIQTGTYIKYNNTWNNITDTVKGVRTHFKKTHKSANV